MAEHVDDFSDLIELGIDISDQENDSLTAHFNKATKCMQGLAGTLDNETLLKMYALYKQALEGPCNVPKPSWYDMRGKAKWEAWNNLGDMASKEAMQKYVDGVLSLDASFTLDDTNQNKNNESWVRVSSLMQTTPTEEKNIIDHIRDKDYDKVIHHLRSNTVDVNKLDEEGMGLIHWAADIGDHQMLELLISYNIDVDLKDSDGQTALHYASSCGHYDCVKILLKKGARADVKDNDSCTPRCVASDDAVKELFQ